MTSSSARSPEHDNTTIKVGDEVAVSGVVEDVYTYAEPERFGGPDAAVRIGAKRVLLPVAALASTATQGENPYPTPMYGRHLWDEGYAAGLAAGRGTADTNPPLPDGSRRRHFHWMATHGYEVGPESEWLCPDGFSFSAREFS